MPNRGAARSAFMKRCACLALLLVAACSSPGHPRPPKHPFVLGSVAKGFTGHGPRVVIVGDSLTYLGWDDLYNRLDRHYAVRIGAWFGEGYDGGPTSTGLKLGKPFLMGVAHRFARSHPAIAVLALGTNDAWSHRPAARVLTEMRAAVAEMKPACLVGVTIPLHSIAPGWSTSVADELNAAMRSWANQVVDWATLSRKPGVLASDGIHTTPAGTALRADAIAHAVEDCNTR